MTKYQHNINSDIAFTHIWSRKSQTVLAALGVTFGVGIFIFINSLFYGFEQYSNDALFKSIPHLRVYKEDKISRPLIPSNEQTFSLISNPKIIPSSTKIINPKRIIKQLKKQDAVTGVTPNVSVNVFFKNGQSQVNGVISGIEIETHDAMFNLASSIVDGQYQDLDNNASNLILSVGIAEKLNIRLGDKIAVTSSQGVSRIMNVMALLKTGNRETDATLAYSSIFTAQQLLKQGPDYISDIHVNIDDFDTADQYVSRLEQLTGYQVEDWKTANASAATGNMVRSIMGLAISFSILLVAGFGIYNILNMTIMQKIKDIAILKAIGFSAKDVISIFLQQALVIGLLGITLGLSLASVLISVLSKVWVGGDLGYFPIDFLPLYFGFGIFFGFLVVLTSGLIPAQKAGKVDPISIFRR